MSGIATPAPRRDGAETRRRAQQTALRLFTEHGYDATSLRRIAEALGITKASLYYHFPSKEAILRSLLEERGGEAEALLVWLDAQPPSPDLLETAVLRWVDTVSIDKLRGIRFLRANPLVLQRLPAAAGDRIGSPLAAFADRLSGFLPDRTPQRVLLLRMAILSINAAVEAAIDSGAADDDVVAAAHAAARALVRELAR